MPQHFDTISFLSDFGRVDEFVGVVHSVIRSIVPAVTVVDVTHDISPYDVRAGALALARAAPYLNPGVALAVVDPGVAGDRRAVAIEVGNGASVLVGPDNGLLAPAVAMVGGATRAVDITNTTYRLEAPGPTFDGRDLFGPVAAHLCAGVPLADIGPEIDTGSLVPGIVPISAVEGATTIAEVLWVDRYGNAQLNLDPDDLDGSHFSVRVGEIRRPLRRVTSFDECQPGEIGLIVDSSGLLALAVRQSSAAVELRLASGAEVHIEPVDAPSVTTAVELGTKTDPNGKGSNQ